MTATAVTLLLSCFCCPVLAIYLSVLTNNIIVSSKILLVTEITESVFGCAILCPTIGGCCASEYETSTRSCKLYSVPHNTQTEHHGGIHTLLPDTRKDVACPNWWIKHNNKCYFFSDIVANWTEAMNYCKHKRSMLAECHSEETKQFLKSGSRSRGHTFWIGGTDIETESVWIWIASKTNLTVNDWEHGESDITYDGGSGCLLIYAPWDYHWVEERCSVRRRFICEKCMY